MYRKDENNKFVILTSQKQFPKWPAVSDIQSDNYKMQVNLWLYIQSNN